MSTRTRLDAPLRLPSNRRESRGRCRLRRGTIQQRRRLNKGNWLLPSQSIAEKMLSWRLQGCLWLRGATGCSSSLANMRPRAGESVGQRARSRRAGWRSRIVTGGSLGRRTPDGVWITIASTECDLSCCVAVDDVIYVGTNDARVLRVGAGGALEQLHGFDAVAGRDTWYAGSAVINGERVGPPLGIRSITATADGSVPSPMSTLVVFHDRSTPAQRGSPQSTSIVTSTRFARTRTVPTS